MKELYLNFFYFLIWTTKGQVIESPHSQVALQDTNVTFTCRGRGSHSILYFVEPNSSPMTDDPPLVKSNLNNYNIFIELAPPVIENGAKTFHWTIRILAAPENNLTEFFCRFVGLEESYDTVRSVLTVANETLSSPGTPQVMMSNFTHILISWSPPWFHSVNNYNVSITNTTSNITTINVTHNNVLILSRDGQLLNQCHTLEIVVTANTDVGSTTSNIFHGGFPKILSPVEEETIRIEIYQRQNGSIKTEITFTKPNVCSYQVLKYSYSVKEQNNTNTTWRNYTTSIPALNIEGLKKNKYYQLVLLVWDVNIPDEVYKTNETFCTHFASSTKTTTGTHITDTTTTTTTTTTTNSSNTTVASTDKDLTLLIGGVTGAGLSIIVIIAILTCALIMLCILVLRIHKRLQQNINISIDPEKGDFDKKEELEFCEEKEKRERKYTIPQVMATNPIYEGNSSVYECLPEMRDLKCVSEQPVHHPTSMYLEIPPQVPPPRKMSIDSPGIKSGTQLSLSKSPLPGNMSVGGTDHTDNEEYVYMKGGDNGQPRYLKSPVMKLRMEGMSEEKRLQIKAVRNDNNKEEKK